MLQVEGDLVMLQVGGDLGYYNLRWFVFIAISSIVQIFPRVQASPISGKTRLHVFISKHICFVR